MTRSAWLGNIVVLGCAAMLCACAGSEEPGISGQVKDEALEVGRQSSSFPAADEDYFHDMDGGVALAPGEIKGRNSWMIWTAGNDRFWDHISVTSFGSFDLLKSVSSHPSLKFSRDTRWKFLGLVNEPCFDKATAPNPARHGLWLDTRRADCPPDPFENEQKYKGVLIGARGKEIPAGSFYGYASGIVGLRLFPNPKFDAAAAAKWDPKRYYEDPSYYRNKALVKPYRVGMACSFCHVGPNPLKPPADPENPKWENLSANVGAQYFWIDRIFTFESDPSNFFFQLFHTSRPGALDTSLVSTDNINNPRTMNAVYGLAPRLDLATRWGKESLQGGERDNRQFNDFVKDGPLTKLFTPPNTAWSPRVLKDGSDSVGALGALNRVYLNIGLFSEEWLLHFRALVGGQRTTPIPIAFAQKNSAYWGATEQQTMDMAAFFLKTTDPHHLKDAPGGAAYLTEDAATVTRGKTVFAERCARCHSSKAPAPAQGVDPGGCSGPNYLDCWNRYWAWTKTDEYKKAMTAIVTAPDFLDHNFLSTDLRVPVTLLETNACSPLATNAIKDNIWDNFSSSTYKSLPSVGTIMVHHPLTGEPRPYKMPAGGRGYTRPASLISLWSTAPFLLNNTVGKFEWSPSVEARMQSFDNSIEQLLWPEKRDKDPVLGDKIPGIIDRTTTTSYLRVPAGYLPQHLRGLIGWGSRVVPSLFGEGGFELGPIPQGMPVNLLSNIELRSEDPDAGVRLRHDAKVLEVLLQAKREFRTLPPNATNDQVREHLRSLVDPLLEVSKCPDFVVNRGHYFGTSYFKEESGLGDQDKRALIAFLKTF